MKLIEKTSDAEMEIMQKIWEQDTKISVADILGIFKSTKDWKSQTVSTFLTRLVEKGFLYRETIKNTNYFSVLITKDQYKNSQTENFLEVIHGGSIKSFMASLVDGNKISNDDIGQLKDWLNKEDN